MLKLKWVVILVFSFEVFAGVRPISFDQALQSILENDFSLKLSENNLERVKAHQLNAYAQFLPSLKVSAAQNRDNLFKERSKSVVGNLDLSLWKNGADVMGIKAQGYSKQSALEHVTTEGLNAESRATKILFDYLYRMQEIDIKRTQLEVRKELLNIAKDRYNRGLIPEHQVLSAEIDLENAESTLTFATIEFQKSKAELERSMGLSKEEEISFENRWPLESEIKGQKVKNILKKNADKSTRSDFQETLLATQISDLNVMQAKANFLPNVDFNAQRGKLISYGKTQYDTSFAITLTIPIFENLSDYTSYRESQYRSIQTKYELLAYEQKFETDFRSKKENLSTALERGEARENILKKGEKLFNLMKSHYRAGKLNYQDFALEQERFFSARLNYVQGLKDVHNALVDYCHSLGSPIKACLQN